MTGSAPLPLSGLVPILFGHAAFQQLNAGCQLGLFEHLHKEAGLTRSEVAERLGIPQRSADMLLLGTTSLGLTAKQGEGYRNGDAIEEALATGQWPVFQNIIEFQDKVSYAPAADYTESLRTGSNIGIRHFPGDTRDLYTRLAHVPGLEELFYRCMNSWSRLSNPVLLQGVDYTGVRRILDVGGGDAVNAIALAQAHPHLHITVLDRPGALEVAREKIERHDLSERITTHAADIFDDAYPEGYDCVLFAHQLVIWSPEQNRALLRKARTVLGPEGRVLIFNAISDDDGTGPLYSGLDNVYFATLPFESSTLYPWRDYEQWLLDAGFSAHQRVLPLSWTPHGVVEGLVTDPGTAH